MHLSEYTEPVRVLLVGDPGSGKTTAIGKLAEHGQRLHICDFDDNLSPLAKFIRPDAQDHIHFETLRDKVEFNAQGQPVVKGRPTAYARLVDLMAEWPEFGPPEKWPPNAWFVLDGVSGMSKAAMWYQLWRDKRMEAGPSLPTRGKWYAKCEAVVEALAAARIPMIVTGHLARLAMEDVTETEGDSSGPTKAKRLPLNAQIRYVTGEIGQKLPTRFGGLFTLVLECVRVGNGLSAARVIRTVPAEDVDIKVPLPPKTVPAEVPIDQLWSILKYFRA